MKLIAIFALIAYSIPAMAVKPTLAKTPSAKDASVYFISPKDGETVSKKFKVQFGLKGMGVAPAGVIKKNTGHHHLIVDSVLKNPQMPIMKDKNHIHFGGGQTEAMVELPKGKHTLMLLLGDNNHIPHVPAVKSKIITVYVK